MTPTTRIYSNTGKEDMNVIGIGTIPAGEQVSVTSVYQPQIVYENYPGLQDITDQPSSNQSPDNTQSGGSSEQNS